MVTPKIRIQQNRSCLGEKKTKNKHGNNCHEQWKCFSPFVLSVDGILGKEALAILTNLSQTMAAKMEEMFFSCVAELTIRSQ